MTDRINGFTVALEKDIRDDDIEATRLAILQIKGVIAVENNVVDTAYYVAASRERSKTTELLYDVIKKLNS